MKIMDEKYILLTKIHNDIVYYKVHIEINGCFNTQFYEKKLSFNNN